MSATLILIPSAFRPLSASLSFVTANLPEGYLVAAAELEAEELRTPGVRGTRFREVFEQYRALSLATLAGFSNYAAAVAAAEVYRRARGSKGLLTVTTNSVTVRLRVMIRAPAPSPVSPVAPHRSSQRGTCCAWTSNANDPNRRSAARPRPHPGRPQLRRRRWSVGNLANARAESARRL
jgi:hypothetical protein